MLSLKNKLSSIKVANKAEGKKRYVFILELVLISLVFFLSTIIWEAITHQPIKISVHFSLLGLFNLLSWMLLYRLTTITKLPRTQRYRQIFFNFIRVGFLQMVSLFTAYLVIGFYEINPLFILFYSVINIIIIFHFRVSTYRIFKVFRAKGYDLHRVVVIADSYSDVFIERLQAEKEWGFKIEKILTNSKLISNKFGDNIPVHRLRTDLREIIDTGVIDEVIYSKGNMKSEEIKEITNLCNEVGVIFRLQSQLSPLRTLKLQMEALNDVNQLSLADHPSNSISQFLKYVSDLYFSFFMLILLFPVFLFIAIIIKIDSPGPVFFKQERIGLRGRKFWLYKFRTMVINAEEVLEKLKEKNEMDGPVFKIKDDPRITKVGRFLRKSGLDELPQLYNVFKGEMSLIGPRPPLEKEVKQYKRWQLRRLSVKPGITCTWQIIPNRNSVNFENWMKLDLQYIDNWSLSKDIRLFFRTIATFFTATGH